MRIINVVYTNTNPDGTTNSHGVVTIPSGQAALLKVPFPYEGRIGKIVCKQLSAGRGGGTAVDFQFAVYSTPVVTPAIGVITLPDNAPLYEAVPIKSALAGTVLRDFTPDVGGDGFLFRNFDADQTKTLDGRYCYVYIAPTAAGGTTKWEFAFAVAIDIG